MDWQDVLIVLDSQPRGERSLLVTALTASHGLQRGLARAGGRRQGGGAACWQPGSILSCHCRLSGGGEAASASGQWRGELLEAPGLELLQDGGRLAALSSACALLQLVLPWQEPQPELYGATLALLSALAADSPDWPEACVRWELFLLAGLGYGLDLERCAVSGGQEDLCWVSPRSGRAVSRQAGQPWASRLLPLPAFLVPAPSLSSFPAPAPALAPARSPWPALAGEGPAAGSNYFVPAEDIHAGLQLTGFFLSRSLLAPLGRQLPPARLRFAARWQVAASG